MMDINNMNNRVHSQQNGQWDNCPTVNEDNGTYFKPMGHLIIKSDF